MLVNGQRIEDSQIEAEFERLWPDYQRTFGEQSPQQQRQQLLEWSRENVIERVLLEQQARESIRDISSEKVEAAFAKMKAQYDRQAKAPGEQDQRKLKEDIELQMKIERLIGRNCTDIPEPTAQDIRKFYEENKQQFTSAEQVRASHIVKHIDWQKDEAEAQRVITKAQDKLKDGAVFEALVAEYSDCPDNGGDLGYISRGQMAEEFEDVVFNLAPGQISDIFRTRFGFHIVKVYGRKEAVLRGIEEVTEQIVEALKQQKHQEAFELFIDRLRSEAVIKEL